MKENGLKESNMGMAYFGTKKEKRRKENGEMEEGLLKRAIHQLQYQKMSKNKINNNTHK